MCPSLSQRTKQIISPFRQSKVRRKATAQIAERLIVLVLTPTEFASSHCIFEHIPYSGHSMLCNAKTQIVVCEYKKAYECPQASNTLELRPGLGESWPNNSGTICAMNNQDHFGGRCGIGAIDGRPGQPPQGVPWTESRTAAQRSALPLLTTRSSVLRGMGVLACLRTFECEQPRYCQRPSWLANVWWTSRIRLVCPPQYSWLPNRLHSVS